VASAESGNLIVPRHDGWEFPSTARVRRHRLPLDGGRHFPEVDIPVIWQYTSLSGPEMKQRVTTQR
jgi:hypothetical protein